MQITIDDFRNVESQLDGLVRVVDGNPLASDVEALSALKSAINGLLAVSPTYINVMNSLDQSISLNQKTPQLTFDSDMPLGAYAITNPYGQNNIGVISLNPLAILQNPMLGAIELGHESIHAINYDSPPIQGTDTSAFFNGMSEGYAFQYQNTFTQDVNANQVQYSEYSGFSPSQTSNTKSL